MTIRNEDALEYHSSAPAGKISITPTKPCHTPRDLSLAYTPGVAVPCLEIHRHSRTSRRPTASSSRKPCATPWRFRYSTTIYGTAIIAGAALLNALILVNKQIDQVKVVFNGVGASSIACAEHAIKLGVQRGNIIMCDSKGPIYEGRTEGINAYKARFTANNDQSGAAVDHSPSPARACGRMGSFHHAALQWRCV